MPRRLLLAVLATCAFWAHALAQEPPAPARVGTPGVVQPRLIREVTPVYPEIARSAWVQGVVVLETTIGASGRVSEARVTRSIKLLDQAALDAVRQWEFAPPLVNGQATPVVTTIVVNFTLTVASTPAPPATNTASPSGIPADFAVVYAEPCKDSLRHVLTRSTYDLDDVHRALSTAGILSGGGGLRSWQDSSFLARTTVLLDRIEFVVDAQAPIGCSIDARGLGPAYFLHVRAGGIWTQIWPPEPRDLQTPENEKKMRAVRVLVQKAIARK